MLAWMHPARRRLALWLLGSLAIHLAALPLVARIEPPPARPRLAVREIELVPLARMPAAATATAPAAVAPRAAPAEPSAGPGRTAVGGRRARPVARTAVPSGASLLAMRGGGEPARTGVRRLDLAPSAQLLLGDGAATRGAARVRERPGASPASEAERTKRNLDELLAQQRDRHDLTSGRVHPFLYTVERTAEGGFRPDWSLVENDRLGRGSLRTSYRNLVVGFARQYLVELERYRNLSREHPEDRDRGKMLEGYNKLMQVAERNASAMACELCVGFEARGELPEIRLRRRSGNRRFDALALESLRRTTRVERPPADAPATEACYEFSASFFRVPPLPMVGCSFDESKPSISCYYPTKKVLRARVKLVSVRRHAARKS
jgi:hypothetical protein